jgi:prevent-host-death family protein
VPSDAAAQFNIHDAKTHLSQIVERVEHGEEIIISRAGHPVAKVIPLAGSVRRRGRGSLRGRQYEVAILRAWPGCSPDRIRGQAAEVIRSLFGSRRGGSAADLHLASRSDPTRSHRFVMPPCSTLSAASGSPTGAGKTGRTAPMAHRVT